jgi:type I restriction enzyme S subunit
VSEKKFDSRSRRLKLSDVCTDVSDRVATPSESEYERFVGLEHMETGETKLRKFGDTTDLVSSMKLFKKGDVLVARRNVYLKRAAVADFDGVCSGDAIVLRPTNNGQIVPGIIPFLLNTENFWSYAIKHAAGTMSKRLSVEKLLQYEFVLPSIETQKSILSVLTSYSELDDTYASASFRALDLLTSHANAIFSNRKYDLVTFEKVLIRQPQSGLYKAQEFLGRGTKIVNMGELFGFDAIVSSIDMKRMELTQEEISKFQLTPNDLLFGRRSIVLEGAGKCSMIGGLQEPVIFESSILRVTVNPEILLPQFIFEWLRSPKGTQQITRIRSFTTVAGIAGSDLKRIVVPVMPIKEQLAISDELSSMRASMSALSQRQMANRALKKAFLEEVFGGCDV